MFRFIMYKSFNINRIERLIANNGKLAISRYGYDTVKKIAVANMISLALEQLDVMIQQILGGTKNGFCIKSRRF